MNNTKRGSVVLYFILMMMHQFFYFLPENIGPLSWFNILFLLSGGMVFLVFCFGKGKFVLGEFGYIILVIPVMIILSAIGAKLHYDQNLVSGIATQRLWLTTAWIYFVIMYLIRRGEITYDSFVQVLYAVVGVELVIYFAQYFIGEGHMFLNVLYNQRNGLRLYCDPGYMFVLSLIALDNLLKKKNIAINLAYIAGILLYYVLIYKARSSILQLFLALGLVLLINRHIPRKWKIAAITAAGILGFLFIWNTDYLRDLVAVVLKQKKDLSWNARTGAYQFYLEKWVSTPYAFLFGYGYGNSGIEASRVATGVTQNFLLADNGVLGFISCYGLLGLIWYICYLAMMIRSGIRACKKQTCALLSRVLGGLIAITMGSHFFYAHYSFDMVFLIIMAELLRKERNEGKETLFPRQLKQRGE